MQPHQHVGAAAFQAALELDGIVAGVEDEHERGTLVRQAAQQIPHLLHRRVVGVLLRTYAPRVERSHPRVALEGESGDQLVGPPGHDGLPGGMPRRMVVVPSSRAGLRVAAVPDAHVHGVDAGTVAVANRSAQGEQLAQGVFSDPPAAQGGVEAAPAAPVEGRQAQVDRRGDRAGGKERIGQIEERVGSPIEAPVERAPEGAQKIEGLG